jgi:large subunit ribosomal protein L18
LIDDDAGVVLLSSSSLLLDEKGKGVELAKKVGETVAKAAAEKGITQIVFDRNGFKFHGRVQAVAEGARAAGMKV